MKGEPLSGSIVLTAMAGYLGAIAAGDWSFVLIILVLPGVLRLQQKSPAYRQVIVYTLFAVAGAGLGRSLHGRWISPSSGQLVRVVTASSSHVWRGAFLLVESSKGDTRFVIQSNRWAGAGEFLWIDACNGSARWLRPAVCKVRSGSKRSDLTTAGQNPWSRHVFAIWRRSILCHLDSFSPAVRDWLKALTLGILPGGSNWARNFKEAGLVHFLVVSGAHVVLIQNLLRRLMGWPVWGLYLCGFLAPAHFAPLRRLVEWLLIFPVTVFCFVCGMDPPVQRALSAVVISSILATGGIQVPLLPRVGLTMALQAFFWPVGFFSVSNAMSWAASLVVSFSAGAGAVPRQLLMYGVMSVLFGVGSAAGLLANLLLLPALEIFFLISLGVAACGPHFAELVSFDDFVRWTWWLVAGASWHFSGPIPSLLESFANSNHVRLTSLVAFSLLLAHVASIRVGSGSSPSGTSSSPLAG
jgi:hypothetical protein